MTTPCTESKRPGRAKGFQSAMLMVAMLAATAAQATTISGTVNTGNNPDNFSGDATTFASAPSTGLFPLTLTVGEFDFSVSSGQTITAGTLNGDFGSNILGSATSQAKLFVDGIQLASCDATCEAASQANDVAWVYSLTTADLTALSTNSLWQAGRAVITAQQLSPSQVVLDPTSVNLTATPVPIPPAFLLFVSALASLFGFTRLKVRALTRSTLQAGIAVAGLVTLSGPASANAPGACPLSNGIQHVVYLQFDNVELERDNPNVPADLEQIPALLNFMKSNGTLLANHHTPLISHTADDILTTLTGVYGDRHGQPIANSYRFFNANGSTSSNASFTYWTDLIQEATATPIMLGTNGLVTPAPWVPFTRNGCDVGQVSVANTVLENNTTDVTTVFGVGSPEANESATQKILDFEGIAVHCGFNSTLCNNNPNARADKLRNELGGYTGYKALFGHKYVAASISPNAPLTDINGATIVDATGAVGFPGFDGMPAKNTLGYVAKMLEAGIPIVFGYISDTHDNQVYQSVGPCGGTVGASVPAACAYGPGEAGYEAKLASYNSAFAAFFARLAADGINASNTLFIISADEQDHFDGTQNPTPAGCDGVTTLCVYDHTATSTTTRNVATIGEVNVNLAPLLKTEKGNTTPFTVHSDMAPNFYITNGQGAQTDAVTRQLERDVASLTAFDAYQGTTGPITDFIVDQAGMSMLHMLTSDPARDPNFTVFLKADFFAFSSGTATCVEANFADCVNIESDFAYNHGGWQPEITTSWVGMVGPGIVAGGQDNTTWTDDADVRPTLLSLVGLNDSYAQDGRVIAEIVTDAALPFALGASNRADYVALAQAYKQINSAVGQLGLKTLQANTVAITSNDANDATFTNCEAKIDNWTATRNNLAQQMNQALQGAEFLGTPVTHATAQNLIAQANSLIAGATCP